MRRVARTLVHILLAVLREDDYAVVLFHALEQVADLNIGLAVTGVFDLAALAEQGVRLVEEEDRPGSVRLVEQQLTESFLRLIDAFAAPAPLSRATSPDRPAYKTTSIAFSLNGYII